MRHRDRRQRSRPTWLPYNRILVKPSSGMPPERQKKANQVGSTNGIILFWGNV
jgi:hypothetical protein